MAAGLVKNPFEPDSKKDHSSHSTSMSAEVHHGAEAGHRNESVLDKLGEGISNIMSSVRIAVVKVFKGIKNFVGGLLSSDQHHGSHHANHGDAHGSNNAPAHTPTAAH